MRLAALLLLATFALPTASFGQKLRIETKSVPDGTVGSPYVFSLEASGGTRPYRWSVVSGSLPPGIVLSGVGILGGLPTTPGSFSFRVEVRDSAGDSDQENVELTIRGHSVSVSSPSTLPDAMVGTAYSYSLSASGGTPPYSWSVVGGSLPGGLTLSSNGTIT